MNAELFRILVEKFSQFKVKERFIQKALDLTEVPELEAVSNAKTIREAEEEYLKAEGCCYDDEKAAFRRWIELAGNEEEVFLAYRRISCEAADAERMLAIRKVAEFLQKSKNN